MASFDYEGDAVEEIVATPGPGQVFGPHVRGFNYDGGPLTVLPKVNFFAFSTTKFGVNAAGGQVQPTVGFMGMGEEILTGATADIFVSLG